MRWVVRCLLCVLSAFAERTPGDTSPPGILLMEGSETYQGRTRFFTQEALATTGVAFTVVTPRELSQSNFKLIDYKLLVVGPKWSITATGAEIRDALNVNAQELRDFIWGGGVLWLNIGGRTPSPREYWTKAWSPYEVSFGRIVNRAGTWPIVIKRPDHPVFRGFKHQRPSLNLGLYFHNLGPEWVVLAGDENGASIMEAPFGNGWILANCTSAPFEAGGVNYDATLLFENILAYLMAKCVDRE